MLEKTKLGTVPLNDIVAEGRVRVDFGDIQALAASINKHGLIQPLAVQQREDGKYELLAGGRRLEAIKLLNIAEVPVRIYTDVLSAIDKAIIEFEENKQRKDFTYDEEVKAKAVIHNHLTNLHNNEDKKWTIEKTAEILRESAANLGQDLALAQAIEAVPSLARFKTKKEARAIMRKTFTYAATAVAQENLVNDVNIDKRHRELIESYVVSDCIEGMKKLHGLKFDLIEIDPPYGVNLFNDEVSGVGYTDVPKNEYDGFIEEVIATATELAAEDSWMIIWNKLERMSFLLEICKKHGWTGAVIPGFWVKPSGPSPNTRLYLSSSVECFLYVRRGNKQFTYAGRSNAFLYRTPSERFHPAERPVELIQEILRVFEAPFSKVLVPFAGSGSTLLAAANLNMKVVGFDISDVYKTYYVSRVQKSFPPYYTSYNQSIPEGEES